ncbi:MAG TPA: extracellular solute-binding protein [Gemmataceae bacterium]|nr:extracellular solute-binding protein [Gemmataceae bacterium]
MTLKLSCPEAGFASAINPLVKAWANRTGATVEVLSTPMTPGDGVDLAVLAFAEFGAWAERGDLAPAPAALRNADNPYQWLSVLPAYRNQVNAWGGQVFGLPLSGDGHVLVYRADRLADKPTAERFAKDLNRKLTPPATWDEFAEVAEFFTKLDGKPSLPGLPDDAGKLSAAFLRVAASFDRQAQSETQLAKRSNEPNFAADVLSFDFRLDTGKPRIAGPGFEAAAGWLARLKPSRGASADPLKALADGAVLAVLSLEELAKLPKDGAAVQPRFGVGPVPGTPTFIDPATGKPRPPGDATANYVPFISGGRVGVVRQSSANAGAAFELLAELSGPEGSQQIVSATHLGVGPFRASHLDRDRMLLWLGYGFDAERSKAFQEALRSFVGLQVGNPTFGFRGPDHASLTASLATELKKIAAGETPPADGLKRVAAAWDSDPTPADVRLKWRRRAAGVN